MHLAYVSPRGHRAALQWSREKGESDCMSVKKAWALGDPGLHGTFPQHPLDYSGLGMVSGMGAG